MMYELKRVSDGKLVRMEFAKPAEFWSTMVDEDAEKSVHVIRRRRYEYHVADWLRPAAFRRDTPGNWPNESFALGCKIGDEVRQSREATKMGVPTEFRDGMAIFRSQKHKNEYAKKFGFVDYKGFN